MRFAAIILAYKEPKQVNILTRQLKEEFSSDIDVFIHVSAGSEWMIEQLVTSKQIIVCPEHIGYQNSGNKKGQWAEDILLRKILYCFSYAKSNSTASYYLVLSGEDLIVKNGLKAFLETHKEIIFMDGMVADKKQRARLIYRWGTLFKTKYDFKFHPIRLLRRALLILYSTGIKINRQNNYRLLDGYTICKNLYWMCLPIDCIDYLLDFSLKNVEIMNIFYKSICPEESYFSTILFNNPMFKKRFNWTNDREYRSLTYYGKFTTSFPHITTKDLDPIFNSNCYFAKKFSPSINGELIQIILKRLEENKK